MRSVWTRSSIIASPPTPPPALPERGCHPALAHPPHTRTPQPPSHIGCLLLPLPLPLRCCLLQVQTLWNTSLSPVDRCCCSCCRRLSTIPATSPTRTLNPVPLSSPWQRPPPPPLTADAAGSKQIMRELRAQSGLVQDAESVAASFPEWYHCQCPEFYFACAQGQKKDCGANYQFRYELEEGRIFVLCLVCSLGAT